MTHKVTVRFGGASGSTVHDYSSQIRNVDGTTAPLIHGGMQADNGSAGMGELILDDVDNEIPDPTGTPARQLAAHNQLIWSEDSPGYEAWLSIGRIDNKNVGRPYTKTAGVNRQWTVQWADANMDLDGLTMTGDHDRPAESDIDRVLWALDTFCNGSPRVTTVFQTHLVGTSSSVAMPAKTYKSGTELVELFDDCASEAGKQYAVVIHQDEDEAGDHTCFEYIDEEDHTTYPCTLSISDQLDEVDGETVFEPHWRQGGASLEAGQELITGIVSRYGLDTTATVTVLDSDHRDQYDYWVKPYDDDRAATATEATTRATAMLHSRWNEHVTHQPSILIPARLHHLLRAGMSIDIKSSAAMGGQYLGTVQTRRIAAIEWAHAGWTDEPLLWANLQLDRTPRKLPLSQGTKPTVQPPSGGCSLLDQATYYPKMDGEELWNGPWGDGGDGLGNQTEPVHSGIGSLGLAKSLANPWSWYTFGGTWTAGRTYTLGFWTIANATACPVTFTFGYDSGTSYPVFEDSVDLTISAAESDWTYHEMVWTAPSTIVSSGIADASGVKLLVLAVDNSDGVAFDDATVQECTDAEPPPASDDDTGDPGSADTGCYSPCDHKHPVQTAAVTPITDTAGDFTATNVEGALAELQSDAETDAAALAAHTGDSSDAHDASAVSVLDTAGNFTGTDVEAVLAELASGGGGGGSLTVEEVDGSPTDSAVTKLIFPNGTLAISSHEATYTPAAGGGGGGSLVGYNTIGGSVDTPGVNQKLYAKSITLANDCTITSIGAYVSSAAGTCKGPIVALYSDNSGAPDKVIGYPTGPAPTLNLSSGARWIDVSLGAPVAAGTYWLVVRTTDLTASVVCKLAYDTGGSDLVASVGSADSWPDWSNVTGSTTTANKFSIRANTI